MLGLGNSLLQQYISSEAGYLTSASWDFDGTDDHINLGDADAIRGNVTNTSAGVGLSVAAWFNIPDIVTNTSTTKNIVSARQFPGGWEIVFTSTRLQWRLKHSSGSNANVAGAFRTLGNPSAGTALRASGWHHVGFTFDGRFMRAFLNGSEYGNVDIGSDDNIIFHGSSTQGADVMIGADPTTNGGTSGNSSAQGATDIVVNEVAMWSGILDEDAWSEIFEAVNTNGSVLDLTQDSGNYDYSSTLTGLYRASNIDGTTATNVANPGTSDGTMKNSLGTTTTVPS